MQSLLVGRSISDVQSLRAFNEKASEIVCLNLGGTHKLMTSLHVLTQCQESKLAKMFEFPELLPKTTESDKSESVFLDRDGPTFTNMINYLRNERREIPIFETTKDEHLFYRELQFWEFPDFNFLEKRLKFPDQISDIFKNEPTKVEDEVLMSWRQLKILHLYDLVG